MKVSTLLAAVTATALAASGAVAVASTAQAYGPSPWTLHCRTYAGDTGTGTGASTYTDHFSLTQTPSTPEQGQTVTLTAAGTTGPLAPSGGVSADSTTMRAVVALSGAQSGTVALTSTGSYPANDVAQFLAMGAWSASGTFTSTTSGEVDASLQLLKIDDDASLPGYSGSNLDRYCADAADSDFKGSNGAVSTTITQAIPVSADVTAPTGAANLTSSGGWPGTSTTLNITGANDDATPASALVAKVSWGDGSAPQTLAAGVTTANHTYTAVGAHPVTATLTDIAGNTSESIVAGTYTVTAPVASFTLLPHAVFLTQSVALKPTSIGSDVTSITGTWGDGTSGPISKTGTESHTYLKAGTYTVKVTLHGTGSETALRTIGTVKVAKDHTAPVVKLTIPAKASHGSSWKKIKGSVSDTGLGAKKVYVTLVEKTGSTYYYFNGSGWLKASSKKSALKKAKRLTATPHTSGAWSLTGGHPHKGLTLIVSYWAVDKAGNVGKAKTYTKPITH